MRTTWSGGRVTGERAARALGGSNAPSVIEVSTGRLTWTYQHVPSAELANASFCACCGPFLDACAASGRAITSGPGRLGRSWDGPVPTAPGSLDDDRLAQPGSGSECRSTDENHPGPYRTERCDEGCRRAPPGHPSADAGLRIYSGARAYTRAARQIRQRAHGNGRVSG